MPKPTPRIIEVRLRTTDDPDADEAQARLVATILSVWQDQPDFATIHADIEDQVIARFVHLIGPPSPANPIRAAFASYLTTLDALFNLSKLKD